MARGKEIKETIAQLKYTVFNENGQVIHPRWQKLSPDFTSLIMEGLEDGNYSVVFFATTNEDKTSFQPTNEGDKFYVSSPSDKPLNEDYLFARMDFSTGKESGSRTIDVPLKRCVGRVEIDVTVVHPYTAYLINKVEVSFDKDSKVYISKTADSEQERYHNWMSPQTELFIVYPPRLLYQEQSLSNQFARMINRQKVFIVSVT